MRMPTASCKSLYYYPNYCQVRGMRATWNMIIIFSLWLSAVSVVSSGDGSYSSWRPRTDSGKSSRFNGVSKRNGGLSYQCQVTYLGSYPRVRAWVGTYPTDSLAALACDVAFFYIGTKKPSGVEFNLEWSEDAILHTCKPQSAYENLRDWDERTRFIRAEVEALMVSLTAFHWEDLIVVPRSDTVRQKAEDVTWHIVQHFEHGDPQPERLDEFTAWLMDPSTEQRIMPEVHAQRVSQTVSKLCTQQTDVMRPLEGDWFGNVHRVTALVESLEARPDHRLCGWLLSQDTCQSSSSCSIKEAMMLLQALRNSYLDEFMIELWSAGSPKQAVCIRIPFWFPSYSPCTDFLQFYLS